MKRVNQKYIIILLMITLLSLTYCGMKYLMKPKYEPLPEVKLKETNDRKSFAIMIQNENGYEEYNNETKIRTITRNKIKRKNKK